MITVTKTYFSIRNREDTKVEKTQIKLFGIPIYTTYLNRVYQTDEKWIIYTLKNIKTPTPLTELRMVSS